MKRHKLLVILLALPLLCSCSWFGYVNEHEGMNSFNLMLGHYELNHFILPKDGFIDTYKYLDAEYKYIENDEKAFDFSSIETSLMVLTYEPEVYKEAKQHCIQEMTLSDTCIIESNGYIFIENTELGTEQGEYAGMYGFPHWFNMFVYNDEINTLLFLGCYNPNYSPNDKQEVMENFEDFLEENFNELYDFSADY